MFNAKEYKPYTITLTQNHYRLHRADLTISNSPLCPIASIAGLFSTLKTNPPIVLLADADPPRFKTSRALLDNHDSDPFQLGATVCMRLSMHNRLSLSASLS